MQSTQGTSNLFNQKSVFLSDVYESVWIYSTVFIIHSSAWAKVVVAIKMLIIKWNCKNLSFIHQQYWTKLKNKAQNFTDIEVHN